MYYTSLLKSVLYAYFFVVQLTIINGSKDKQMATENTRRIEQKQTRAGKTPTNNKYMYNKKNTKI